jgi:ubiquinone/menaquinone biosynthesis C-methylase UbiE
LTPESPKAVIKKIPKVLLDTFLVGKRRTQGFSNEFTPTAQEFLEGLPRYYQRNFHFQSDGYLSERSAEVYDYEVDLLFSGAADAMRRLILAPLKKHFHSNPTGKGLRFLEIGAGTGRSTQFVKLAFPKAEVVCLDLSEPYLKVAQRNLSRFNFVSFLRGDGSCLPFKDCEFDAVYSVFLFHEMPRKIRVNVLEESLRVLKKGGFLGFVDSVQKGDYPQFDPFLEDFPKYFHEPFYLDYIRHPMKDLFRSISSAEYHSDLGFFSKLGFIEKES